MEHSFKLEIEIQMVSLNSRLFFSCWRTTVMIGVTKYWYWRNRGLRNRLNLKFALFLKCDWLSVPNYFHFPADKGPGLGQTFEWVISCILERDTLVVGISIWFRVSINICKVYLFIYLFSYIFLIKRMWRIYITVEVRINNVTQFIASIFISLFAVLIYDFHIVTLTVSSTLRRVWFPKEIKKTCKVHCLVIWARGNF